MWIFSGLFPPPTVNWVFLGLWRKTFIDVIVGFGKYWLTLYKPKNYSPERRNYWQWKQSLVDALLSYWTTLRYCKSEGLEDFLKRAGGNHLTRPWRWRWQLPNYRASTRLVKQMYARIHARWVLCSLQHFVYKQLVSDSLPTGLPDISSSWYL